MTASKPPNRAQNGGTHACSIQHVTEHIRPTLNQTAVNGEPVMILPAASSRPWAGGYIDAYVG